MKRITRESYLRKKIKKLEKKFDSMPRECKIEREKILKRSAKLLSELEEILTNAKTNV